MPGLMVDAHVFPQVVFASHVLCHEAGRVAIPYLANRRVIPPEINPCHVHRESCFADYRGLVWTRGCVFLCMTALFT